MPGNSPSTKSVLQLLEWDFTPPPGYRGRTVNCIFREWHRGFLLGLEVNHLKLGGREITGDELQRLNFWIAANGAWRASALPYWDGFNLLVDVLSGNLGVNFLVGNAGAGRSYRYEAVPLLSVEKLVDSPIAKFQKLA